MNTALYFFQIPDLPHRTDITCESSCSYYNGHRTLCDLTAPNTCPTVNTQQGPLQLVCKQSSLLPTGYGICTNP